MIGLYHIKADGSVGDLERRRLNLVDAQKLVGGYIETVALVGQPKYGVGQQCLVVNEEGLIHGLPENASASARAGQRLVGDAVLIEWEKEDLE